MDSKLQRKIEILTVLFIFIGYFVAFVYCDYYGSGFPANSPSLDPEPFVYKKIPIHYLSSTHGIGFAGYGGGDGPMRKYMGALSPYHHVGYPMPNYSYHHPKDPGSASESGSHHEHSNRNNHNNNSSRSPLLLGMRVNGFNWLKRPFRKGIFDRILG
uniref:Uncharacterized protein n=1 Tax=Tetranychus urticae TaxID=32264 RepID=T1KDE8_TETUR